MCGDQALRNVAIVTNMWGKVTQEVGDARGRELANNFFKPALDKGAMLCRHNDTVESAHSIIGEVLEKEQVVLQIQVEIADERKRIEETGAGRELLRELDDHVENRLRQLRELQEMLDQTEADDGETRQELQQEVLKLREELGALSRTGGGPTGGFRGKVVDGLFFGALSAGLLLYVRIK